MHCKVPTCLELKYTLYAYVLQEWSDVSDDDEDTEPLSREDSGIQVDRTPQEDQDQNKKSSHVTWKGLFFKTCLI